MANGQSGRRGAKRIRRSAIPSLTVGDCFLKVGAKPHLWIICTLPDQDRCVVGFSIMTLKARTVDRTCVLEAGHHPFITRKSAVRYSSGRLWGLARLNQLRGLGKIKVEACASSALVSKVRVGAVKSGHTPRHLKTAINACSWVPDKAKRKAPRENPGVSYSFRRRRPPDADG